MSRAFVKEPDGDDAGSDLPDRPISAHRNFVTSFGLARIDADIETAKNKLALAQAKNDKASISAAGRDLRYWTARRSNAELVAAPTGAEARFGSTVTIERADGRTQTFKITGEDEADPSIGTLSYVSPLARTVIGRSAGDECEFMGETIAVSQVRQG